MSWTHPRNKKYENWTDEDADWIEADGFQRGQKDGARLLREDVEEYVRVELGKKLSPATNFTLTDKDYKEVLVALVTKFAKENEKR
jgi:hypothetical protein